MAVEQWSKILKEKSGNPNAWNFDTRVIPDLDVNDIENAPPDSITIKLKGMQNRQIAMEIMELRIRVLEKDIHVYAPLHQLISINHIIQY